MLVRLSSKEYPLVELNGYAERQAAGEEEAKIQQSRGAKARKQASRGWCKKDVGQLGATSYDTAKQHGRSEIAKEGKQESST